MRWLSRRRWDDERAREMQAHLAHMVDDLVARGVAPDEARRQAHREFGNPTLFREDIYEMNSVPVLEPLLRDLRYAWRVLRNSPGFTATAIMTLALAIGINTAVFTVVHGVLLRPLPYPAPERLALVEATVTANGLRVTRTSQHGVTWATIRDHATTADRAVFSTWANGVNVMAGDRAIHARQQRVGAGFFGVLGVAPLDGREFTTDEDVRGGPAVVIISDRFWRGVLGGEPDVVGRTLLLRGEPHTIVGVMPADAETGVRADLWTPLRPTTDGEGGGENYQVLLRLRPDATWAMADAELARLGPEINRLQPVAEGTTITYGTTPLHRGLTESIRRPLLILWAAVGLVLVIACINLAGLFSARTARRSREISTRLALGSGRAAIVRQLLTESLVVGIAGAALGLVLAALSLDSLRALAQETLDVWRPIALDGYALGLAILAGLLATAVAGLLPAIQSTRAAGLTASGTRSVSGPSRQFSRRLVIVSQVALGVVLLVGAALLVRTFTHLRGLDPGFDGTNVHAATVSLQDARYASSVNVARLASSTLDRLQASSRVEAAAISLGLPYERLLNLGFRHLDGAEAAGDPRMTSATYVAGDYFRALRIPLRAGRTFDDRDGAAAAPVAIVNETIAREYFGSANPVGRRIAFAGAEREIIGVVGDVVVRPGFGDRGPLAAMPLAYIPLAQANDGFLRLVHGWFATAVIVRGPGSTAEATTLLRGAVDPLLPIASVRSIREVQSAAVAQPRLMMALLTILATAALLLSAVGIHGLVASSVTERTREMGIRIALGATMGRAVADLVLPVLALAAVGILAGLAAARTTVTLLEAFVWGTSPTDPATFAAVAVLFLGVAAVASVAPALRILRLDPATTLRAE
jgi:predicted permease